MHISKNNLNPNKQQSRESFWWSFVFCCKSKKAFIVVEVLFVTIIYISFQNMFKLYYDIWYCLSFIDKNKMSICNQLITKSNLFTILFDKTNILWGLHTSKKTFQNIFRRIRVDTKWTSKTSFWTLSSSFNDVGKWDVDPIFL